MRNKIFYLWVLSLLCLSCSVDEVMKHKNNLNVILLETIELPENHVGDTIRFKVFAGTNDIIERMEITNATHDFSSMLLEGGIRYEIIEDTLYTDAEGYFNRPVSSVVVNYPIIVARELLEQVVGLDFTFYTNKGVKQSTRAQMKIINYLLYPDKKDVYGLIAPDDDTYTFTGMPFYASGLNQTYSFGFLSAEPSGKEDAIEGEELTGYIDLFQYQEYTATDTINHFYSPNHERVQELADTYEIVYDYHKMRHTVFTVLPEGFDFNHAYDPEINAIDFSGATDHIVFKYDSDVAFLTEDGFKGIMHITKNSRNDGRVTPVIQVKRQTVAL